MNRLSILFATLATAGLVSAGIAQAADAPATPATPQTWAGKMLESTQNAAASKDLAASQPLTQAPMNPAALMDLMPQGIDPNTAIRMLAGMQNLAAMRNAMQFSDPAIVMKWQALGLDPRLFNALLSQGIDPSNYLNMLMAAMSPQMMNPGFHGNWMAAPMNPNMNMMGAGMNSNIYGPYGQMLNIPIDPAVLMKLLQMSAPAPAPAPAAPLPPVK